MSSLFTAFGRLASGLLLLLMTSSVYAESADVALRTYIESVLQAHPELQAADARVNAARAQADALSRPLHNPELGLEGERAQSEAYAIGLSQTLDLSGKRRVRDASGQAQLAATTAERTVLRANIVTEVLKALAELAGRRTTAALAQQRLELLQRFSEVAEQRYRAGDIGILDRDLAVLAHAESIALAGRAELELLRAQQALDTVTRNSGNSPPVLPELLPAVDGLNQDFGALAQSLPGVRAALAKRDMAIAETNVVRSQTRPDPTISVRAGRERDRGGSNGEPLVGLQLSIPLFVRNNFKAETTAAGEQASAASIEADGAYRLALQHMQASSTQYGRAYAAWQRWSGVSQARIDTGVELLDRVWRVREISTADYVLQLKQLLDGRTAGEELRTQAWASWIEWLAASGQSQVWLNGMATPTEK